MSRTPAATLARVKLAYQDWAITRVANPVEGRQVCSAVHPDGRSLLAATPELLEVELFEACDRRAATR